jgi:hypothetical protein
LRLPISVPLLLRRVVSDLTDTFKRETRNKKENKRKSNDGEAKMEL